MDRVKVIGIRSALCGAASLVALAGCQRGSAFREPAARLNPDMAKVVTAYQGLGAQPVSTLSVQQARTQPGMADAVRAVQQAQAGSAEAETVMTRDLTVPGAAGPLPARLYDPTPGRTAEPITLYFHGGGWVDGDIQADDASARILAAQSHGMVLSLAYRLAPETPFPGAQDDAFAAYRWLLDNAASLGADPRRIAVAGAAAGGALALDTTVAARDAHIQAPVHNLLIEPIVSPNIRTRSAIANARSVPLNQDDVKWYLQTALPNEDTRLDPRTDPLEAADLHAMPPTTIISAEMDPLESDGRALTQKLMADGVEVARVEYQGTAHGFFGAGAVVARAKEADAFAGAALNATFQQIGDPPPPAEPPRQHRRARHARVPTGRADTQP